MVGFIQICLSIALLCPSPASGDTCIECIDQCDSNSTVCYVIHLNETDIEPAEAGPEVMYPVKHVGFNATYQTSNTTLLINESCARYYGRTFLAHMTTLSNSDKLSEICVVPKAKGKGGRERQNIFVSVIPTVTAVVSVPVSVPISITIVTNLKISIQRSVRRAFNKTDHNSTIEECKEALQATLTNETYFTYPSPGHPLSRLARNDTLGCMAALMKNDSAHLVYTSQEKWECLNKELDPVKLECVQKTDPTTTSQQSQTSVMDGCHQCVQRFSSHFQKGNFTCNDPDFKNCCDSLQENFTNCCISNKGEVVGNSFKCVDSTLGVDTNRTEKCNTFSTFEEFVSYVCSYRSTTQSTIAVTSPGITTTAQSTTESTISSEQSSPVTLSSRGTTQESPTSTEPPTASIKLNDGSKSIEIEEGQDKKTLNVTFSAVRTKVCEGSPDCDIYAVIKIISEGKPTCRSKEKDIEQVVVASYTSDQTDTNYCRIPIKHEHVTVNIPFKAKMDGKYENTQSTHDSEVIISMYWKSPQFSNAREIKTITVVVKVKDGDEKATCQSINDPHITTFDGLEYNNFFEGEFVLYRHKKLKYQVNAIFQKCGPGVDATCNCGVAVKSGDDVIVFDKCHRNRKVLKRPDGSKAKQITPLRVQLFLNKELTRGTQVYQANDGKLYYVLLPHGGVVKVMVNDDLLNVWVVASPADKGQVEGLCGDYDGDHSNDAKNENGTVQNVPDKFLSTTETLPDNIKDRWQPNTFSLSWRKNLKTKDSIYEGVEEDPAHSETSYYCECLGNGKPRCGYGLDVETCDKSDGEEITMELVRNAISPIPPTSRRRKKKKVPTATLR